MHRTGISELDEGSTAPTLPFWLIVDREEVWLWKGPLKKLSKMESFHWIPGECPFHRLKFGDLKSRPEKEPVSSFCFVLFKAVFSDIFVPKQACSYGFPKESFFGYKEKLANEQMRK